MVSPSHLHALSQQKTFHPTPVLLIVFFANLLPEGGVRGHIVRDLKIPNTDFDLLRAIERIEYHLAFDVGGQRDPGQTGTSTSNSSSLDQDQCNLPDFCTRLGYGSRVNRGVWCMKRFSFLAVVLLVLMQPVKADVLVLVHGYMADSRSWDASGVTATLAAHGWQPAGVLTLTPNGVISPGAPASSADKTYSVNLPAAAPLQVQATVLARLLGVLRQWYPEERLILAGHSAGGVVARMMLTGQNPYRVDTLVTIASPHLGTTRAAQGLDLVDFNPFFCPGPGIDFMKHALGGDEYDYLEHSRGALIDLLPEASGNILAWLNRQHYPDVHYFAIVHTLPYASDDNIVPAYSQDMNNVPALRGRAETIFIPASHGLNPQDGVLLASLLARPDR